MPPFRKGLLKRKLGSGETVQTLEKNVTGEEVNESDDDEDLIRGTLNTEGDDTDSAHDSDAVDSDHEPDGVLFSDDVDSTLGDEKEEEGSDESSELTDSEADDESDKIEEDNDESEEDENSDSGDESGLGQTNSGSSDEEQRQETQNKPKKAKEKQKSIQINSKDSKAKGIQKNIQIESKNTKENEVEKKEEVNNKGNKSRNLIKSKRKNIKVKGIVKENEKSSIDVLADKIKETAVSIKPVEERDEYESGDTSDEEDRRNTVGEVPMWWYREYPHVGYDLDGRRIIKPPQRDQIDEFLKRCEDPDFWRTVRDPQTGQDVVLSKEDLELIARIREGRVPNPDHNEYEPWVEWFSSEVLATPLRAFPEHKRSFLPSKSDEKQISRIVHALKMGWTKTRKQLAEERRKKREKHFYNLWGSSNNEEEEKLRGIHRHIPAPRRPPPGHAESYNPPPEYLLDAKEMKEWNKLSETPWKRKYTFLPTKYSSLRAVPAYERFIRERFLRCLDLYLAPRAIKMRLTISPEDLVPKLPSPRDLQPFPTTEVLQFKGHEGLVRSVDFDPTGEYVVSGSDDGTVKVWETSTGRCLRTISLGEPVVRVLWSPAQGVSLVAAAVGNRLMMINPGSDIGDHEVARRTDELLEEPPPMHDVQMDERTSSCVTWDKVKPEEWVKGIRIAVTHFRPVTHLSWHVRGDYIAATLRDAASRAVVVHQLSRRRSQLPFNKPKGLVQCAIFHTHRPLMFVATQRAVRVYDLVKQELVRKLMAGAQWISNMALHPAGDNLLVSTYDRKCVWFDLELSSKPYQTLRLHGGAVRSVAFHKRYPLFASAGDDQYIVVSHGMVYNDLLQNPLLVPLKQLSGPSKRADLCVTELRFHPTQPWLLAAAADSTIRLYA